MNRELLAGFAESCTDAERVALAAALRAGGNDLASSRPRNGLPTYDPTPVREVLAALASEAAHFLVAAAGDG